MKLQCPFIQLPLVFDADLLASEVAALGETSWRPHPQKFPGNFMLPLVAVDGDPDNESFAGVMRPTLALQRCAYLMQVFASLGITVGRSRLMRLAGQAEVTRHADQGYYWAERVRVHVPIVTQPSVRFECGDAAVNMAAGECWIFDTWRQHRVLNDAVESRIHLVIDTVGGAGFWELVAAGRPHDAPSEGWRPHAVAPQPIPVPAFACETMNIPEVMTPWEMNAHFAMLFADVLPHPAASQVREVTTRFTGTWQALWSAHGDAMETRALFRAALDRYLDEVKAPSQQLRLNNELPWFSAMVTIVAKFAVGGDAPSTGMSAGQQRSVGDNA